MDKKTFLKTINDCFKRQGCFKVKRKYVFRTQNTFVAFMVIRSDYCDCYYIDYNFVVKGAHPDVTIETVSERDFDMVLQPRLKLADGSVELKPEDLSQRVFELNLNASISHILKQMQSRDLDYIRALLKPDRDYAISKVAAQFLGLKQY